MGLGQVLNSQKVQAVWVMNMNEFELILTSYDGCDYFVTEIWYQSNLIAIVKDNDEIQLFDEDKNRTIVKSDLFKTVMDMAKKKLKG